MKNKQQRQKKIKEIIAYNEALSQSDILHFLKKAGYEITQATLSRDLRELKIAKVPGINGKYKYSLPAEEAIYNHTKHSNAPTHTPQEGFGGFISISFSHNIAVIKTTPGFAGSIAYDIDSLRNEVILGTIAGDDTIFIVLKETTTIKEAYSILSQCIPALQGY